MSQCLQCLSNYMNLTNPIWFLTLHKPFDLPFVTSLFPFDTDFWCWQTQHQYFFRLHQTWSMSHACLDYCKVFCYVCSKKEILFLFSKLNHAKFEFRRLGFFPHISFIFWWHSSFATKVAQEFLCFCHLTLDMKWVSINILIKNCVLS